MIERKYWTRRYWRYRSYWRYWTGWYWRHWRYWTRWPPGPRDSCQDQGRSRCCAAIQAKELGPANYNVYLSIFRCSYCFFFYSILTLAKKSRNHTYTAICASLTTPGGVWAWNCCFPPEKSKEFKTSHRMITGSKSYEWIYDRSHIKKGKTSTINYQLIAINWSSWVKPIKTRCQIWCTIEAHRDPISKVLSDW